MIVIRAPRPEEDTGPLTAATNMPGVRRGTLRMPYTGEAFMLKRLSEPSPNVHQLVAAWDGLAVGMGSLMLGMGRRRHSGDIFLFIHDDYWGRGIGRALLGALLDLADNWYGLSRIGLEASPSNDRAIALYETHGFVREGLKRADVILEGQLEDSVVMGRIRLAPAPAEGDPT
ncbi:GNAT family N-acetyltransferase [Pseudoruegeria sp. HB172150]|uniref:GNAT family N-acetyltransferase n=1 Tax=Pseudoruegeria sp. HB172150 TaxID=2721164 RepID=UPI001551DC81|nr:GNAT family N-acetyltransferase [Pseudoruegeria sp. HB172150]